MKEYKIGLFYVDNQSKGTTMKKLICGILFLLIGSVMIFGSPPIDWFGVIFTFIGMFLLVDGSRRIQKEKHVLDESK